MGGGKKSSAPSAPDYTALAKAQGEADKKVAQYTTAVNRPNQSSPYGTSGWTWGGAGTQARYQGDADQLQTYGTQLTDFNTQLAQAQAAVKANPKDKAARQQIATLNKSIRTTTAAQKKLQKTYDKNMKGAYDNPLMGDWQQTTTLTPQEQAIFDAEQQNRLSMEGLASKAIGSAGGVLGTQWSPQLRAFMEAQGLQASNTGLPQYMQDRVGLAGNTLEGMGDLMEGDAAFSADAERVRDAMYQQMTQFSNERFNEQEATERNRLAQMGLQEGTQAYQNALQEFRRSKDESYQTAQLNAILAGGQEQSRLRGDQLAARESNIGLRQGMFNQNMSRDQMDMAERMGMFSNDAQRYQLDQSERQAQATSQLNLANLAASQRQQQFNEQAYQRSLPINEISALLGGGGVNMPQFAQFAQATPFNSPDLLGAGQAQYNASMGAYNSGQQQKGSLLGAGAGFMGGFLGGK